MTADIEDDAAVSDGFGSVWPRCGPDCRLEVVRPGKVQCECDLEPGEMARESWDRVKDSLPYWRLRANRLARQNAALRERVATLEDGLRGLVDDYTPPDHWRIGEEMAVPTDRLRDLLDGGAS